MRLALILGLCLMLSACGVASKTAMPRTGEPSRTGQMPCPSGEVEVHLYDYNPPRDDIWLAIGFAAPGKPDFAVIYSEKPDGERKVYLDLNQDGRVDKVLTLQEAQDQYPTVCELYEREIARRQASR
jgi:hypothetical protein